MLGFNGLTGSAGYDSDDQARACVRAYAEAMKACRRRGIGMLVSVGNQNVLTAKYKNRPPTPAQFRRSLDIAVGGVLAEGADSVLVQVIAECTGEWQAVDKTYAAVLKQAGFKTVWNGGSRPTSKPPGDDYLADPPTKLTDFGPPGCLLVTDTGPVIAALSAGDVYAPRFTPAPLRAWRRTIPPDRRPLADGFWHPAPDRDACASLRP
jgi:hypothetical protein